jgi:hypothetical protein
VLVLVFAGLAASPAYRAARSIDVKISVHLRSASTEVRTVEVTIRKLR